MLINMGLAVRLTPEHPVWDHDKVQIYLVVSTGQVHVATIHGGEHGWLWAEPWGFMSPMDLREAVTALAPWTRGLELVIAPCYPALVRERWAQELQISRITVLGDWNDVTHSSVSGGLLWAQDEHEWDLEYGSAWRSKLDALATLARSMQPEPSEWLRQAWDSESSS